MGKKEQNLRCNTQLVEALKKLSQINLWNQSDAAERKQFDRALFVENQSKQTHIALTGKVRQYL